MFSFRQNRCHDISLTTSRALFEFIAFNKSLNLINCQSEGRSLHGIYELRYKGIKKIIDNNKMFKMCRQIAALLNEKDESEYVTLTCFYLL